MYSVLPSAARGYLRDYRFFVYSIVIYILINIIENYVHYNIGKHTEDDRFIVLTTPSNKDWVKIVVVMLAFAVIHAFLVNHVKDKWNL